jgi:hypothetical protein
VKRKLLVAASAALFTVAVVASTGAPEAAEAGAEAQGAPLRREFPDATSAIRILTDQLPGGMSEAQIRFAATHYVGTQKLTLNLSRPLRAINPDFLVLHYRLAMWQSAPHVNYITAGNTWSNDFPFVTRHESWFWHNASGKRVASSQDGKLLMNIADPGFRAYWRDSIAQQVESGDFDGVFLDSASPALLQWEARSPLDRRLLGTGARFHRFPEFGNRSWIQVWEDWIGELDRSLASRGIPLIPNVGTLSTSWDNADYSRTAGVFCEGFLDPGLSTGDWRSAANQTLTLASRGKIVILQNYLASPDDLQKRMYLLGSYLLVKGSRTYLEYFASSPLEWYPEWNLDLGAPRTSAQSIDAMAWHGVYRRDYDKGVVLVNPSARAVDVRLDRPMRLVNPIGGGAVGRDGTAPGRIDTSVVSAIRLEPKSAVVLLHRPS